jgi:hypothetical protein
MRACSFGVADGDGAADGKNADGEHERRKA